MTSPPHVRCKKDYALTQTPPNSPRIATRVSTLTLYSVIGIYAAGILVWGMNISGAFVSSSSNSLNVVYMRGRQKAAKGDNDARTMSDKRYLLDDENRPPNLLCIGWKETDSCDSNPTDKRIKNRGCDQFVNGGSSGYCLMEDEDTGQQLQVMHTACDSLHPSVVLSCRLAGDFVNFKWGIAKLAAIIEQEKITHREKSILPRTNPSKGIVMVIYPKLLISAYASIRTLRALNCTLPVELWYIESEMNFDDGTSLLDDVPKKLQEMYGPVTLHQITDGRVKGFKSKVWAITHTALELVLFLDADNVPVRDPSYLFEQPELGQSGAVFWPDYWHPAHTIFNINENSLLWELLDMPFLDMFEQESGQLVIDKTKSSAALQMLTYLAFHDPDLFSQYKLVHGDKDLFRLAWLKTKTPFHMIAYPPGLAGTVRNSKFCGMSMVQYGTNGEILFLHRNGKKLTGGLTAKHTPDKLVWTHLQRFRYRVSSSPARKIAAFTYSKVPSDDKSIFAREWNNSREPSGIVDLPYDLLRLNYSVQIFNGAPEFAKTQWCYGQSMITAPDFTITSWNKSMIPIMEETLLQYANEAVILLTNVAKEKIVQSDRQEVH
ncbi:putative alpha-mannosyltransferase, nucleotide-diphospho-sugar transferase [Plasmopara halstedii]